MYPQLGPNLVPRSASSTRDLGRRLTRPWWDCLLCSCGWNECHHTVTLSTNIITEAHVPAPRYGHYFTHALNHISRVVAAMDSCFALYWGSSAWHNRRTSERKVKELELACGASVSPFGFGAKRDRGRGVSVLIAREIKREPKDKYGGGREEGKK